MQRNNTDELLAQIKELLQEHEGQTFEYAYESGTFVSLSHDGLWHGKAGSLVCHVQTFEEVKEALRLSRIFLLLLANLCVQKTYHF